MDALPRLTSIPESSVGAVRLVISALSVIMLSPMFSVVVLIYVVVPLTVKSPLIVASLVTIKSCPTVKSTPTPRSLVTVASLLTVKSVPTWKVVVVVPLVPIANVPPVEPFVVIVKLFPIVTSFGKPIVSDWFNAVVSISLAVPSKLKFCVVRLTVPFTVPSVKFKSTFPTLLSTYALILCCVASPTLLSLTISSSSSIRSTVVVPAAVPT